MSIPNVYEVAEQSRKQLAEMLESKATDLIQHGHVFAAAACLRRAVRFFDAANCATEAGHALLTLRELKESFGRKTIDPSPIPHVPSSGRGLRIHHPIRGVSLWRLTVRALIKISWLRFFKAPSVKNTE